MSQSTSITGTTDELPPDIIGYFGPIKDGKVIGWMPPGQSLMEMEPHFGISIAFRERNPRVLFDPHVLMLCEMVRDIVDSEVWIS
jgi:hypothetical protein